MLYRVTIGLLAAILLVPALAWGPKAQLAISTTAMHLLSKEGNIPLTKMGKSVRRGAAESQSVLAILYPDMEIGPIQAIEAEMILLTAARGNKLDHYYAYRMGALGKLVAQTTAPMAAADASFRNLYFTDVERAIESTSVAIQRRETVDPPLYFSRRIAEANANNDIILKEYQGGVGISGVAGTLLSADTSRSARSVADVWLTILSSSGVSGNVSPEMLRDYGLRGMRFYISRKNTPAMDAAEQRYARLASPTSASLVELGDLYFKAEYYERAVEKYQEALSMDPERREVIGKISDYYVAKGARELENEQLEAALSSLQKAVDTNPLHETAEGRRLAVAKLIEERDARMAENQVLIERAEQLGNMAEEEALRGHHAEAIDLIREAMNSYEEVSDEFPLEFNLRERGLNQLRSRVQAYKNDIMDHAEVFSGSGYVQDVRRLVEAHGDGMDTAGLKAILERAYNAEYAALEQSYGEKLNTP
jgi:tetratricopeptide (TPR) repeat protein